jgi:hypothetical protein
MRLYSFTNYYLSPLQLGLQTAHVVGELTVPATNTDRKHRVATEWALFHKTIVILNGGNSASLDDLHKRLELLGNALQLPTAIFREDLQSLNGATTAVGIVVPAHVYDYAASEFFSVTAPIYESIGITADEHDLAVITRSCPLAR